MHDSMNVKANEEHSLIFGCGDIGRRIAEILIGSATQPQLIAGYVNSEASLAQANSLGLSCNIIDLDSSPLDLSPLDLGACNNAQLYYTVAPQKHGLIDQRSRRVIAEFVSGGVTPRKVVLISTTGVYGDSGGDWVSESTPTKPQAERAHRRLDSESQWLNWGRAEGVDVVVLRVPGIYAFSRLPRERLKRQTPVVRASECGFTNRIHADDLARICVAAMLNAPNGEIYNATDGTPGKISDYLQAAAQVLNYEPLPEISLKQAQSQFSEGMLSYLNESRRISNKKMLEALNIELRYPDFKQGLLS